MKHCISIAWLLLLVCNAHAAPTNMSLTVSTNWVLQQGHTNFFSVNSNALNAAVNTNTAWNATVHSASGSATNLTASGWLLVDAAQTNTGALTVAGPYVIPATGSITGPVVISNAANVWDGGTVSATAGRLTNGVYFSPVLSSPLMTNGINYGNAFSSPGSGLNSEQFGSSTSSGEGAVSLGYGASASGTYSTSIGSDSASSGNFSTAIGEGAASYGVNSLAVGGGASSEQPYSVALGAAAAALHTNSVAIGYDSSTTENFQIMLGSSSVNFVKTFGRLEAGGGITNGLFTGAVTNNASYSETRLDIATLAAGANAGINPGSAVNLKVSGPTNSFSIAGIAGGRDGRVLSIQNSTGHALTILNDSGLESAATNRIYTGSGDIVLTNNPTVFTLIYDSSVSRWILRGFNAPSVGIVEVTLAGNNTFTGTNTFNVPVIVGEPTATNHAATKAYVDANAALLDAEQIFTGTNQFAGPVGFTTTTHSNANGATATLTADEQGGLKLISTPIEAAVSYNVLTLSNSGGFGRTFGFNSNGIFYISGGNTVVSNDLTVAGNATVNSNLTVTGGIVEIGETSMTLDATDQFFIRTDALAVSRFYSPITGPNGDAEILIESSGVHLIDCSTNSVLVKINSESLNAGGAVQGWTANCKIVRVDNSTNTLTVENILKEFGMTIDGLPSVTVHPLCGGEFVGLQDFNIKSTLNNVACLPTYHFERVQGGQLLTNRMAAYPGSPYNVPAFPSASKPDFSLVCQNKIAVTNVWFPNVTVRPFVFLKLVDTPTEGQTNVTVAARFRIAAPGDTFAALASLTNTITLEATNTLYRLNIGSIANNALSGLGGVAIEGHIERLTGGDGDITDDVVAIESLAFEVPLEVPTGSGIPTP